MEPAVEREAATVIATAQLLLVPGSVDDERAAMRAHVRERVHAVLSVAREKERFVEGPRQQRERIDLSRDLHDIVVRDVLPGARENAVLLRAKKYRIGIHASRQRARDADIRIDRECGIDRSPFAHRSGCYRTHP